MGLGDAIHKRPAELSAGMRQRVGLARAFALSPKLLLARRTLRHARLAHAYGAARCPARALACHDGKTALMVTHDVDEALFLSDRVVMMTNGPAADVGGILDVPFARPRERHAVLDDPEYYELRERLIGFLEDQRTCTNRRQWSLPPSPRSLSCEPRGRPRVPCPSDASLKCDPRCVSRPSRFAAVANAFRRSSESHRSRPLRTATSPPTDASLITGGMVRLLPATRGGSVRCSRESFHAPSCRS